MVAARSAALMPVVDALRSTETVNAVRMASSFSLLLTIRGRLSLSAVSLSTETHTNPELCRISEVHRLGRHLVRRADQVTLVLAVLVVQHHHELARGDVRERVLDGRKPGRGLVGVRSAPSASGCHEGTAAGRAPERAASTSTPTKRAGEAGARGAAGGARAARHRTGAAVRRADALPALALTTAPSAGAHREGGHLEVRASIRAVH